MIRWLRMRVRLGWFRIREFVRFYRTEQRWRIERIAGVGPAVRMVNRRRAARMALRLSRETTNRKRLKLAAGR